MQAFSRKPSTYSFVPLYTQAKFSWGKIKEEFRSSMGRTKVARYVYERMDPQDRERTYKPFFIYMTRMAIVQGPGGKFTHHRGIYFGFSKCSALNKNGEQVNVDTCIVKEDFKRTKIIILMQENEKPS